jgi:hypothetical protein
VDDYLRAVEKRKTALVVSPTHKEADLVIAGIRAGLKERGLVEKDEKEVLRLRALNYTTAQKQHFANYERGQVVEFVQNTKGGFAIGSRFYVVSVDMKGQKIGLSVNPKAKTPTHTLPLNAPERFNVYKADKLPLSISDEIRINLCTVTNTSLDRWHNNHYHPPMTTEPNDGYGIWEISAGIASAGYVSHLLLKNFPKIVESCGFDTLANTARTAAVFSGIITTGFGVAFYSNKLRNRHRQGQEMTR